MSKELLLCFLGKTTIVYKFKLNETIQVIPSCGFNIETITIENRTDFTVWDISGKEKIRRIFKRSGHYYDNTEGNSIFDLF
jgi:GTPase SAR1 family protein